MANKMSNKMKQTIDIATFLLKAELMNEVGADLDIVDKIKADRWMTECIKGYIKRAVEGARENFEYHKSNDFKK